jgi:hypothetical protein
MEAKEAIYEDRDGNIVELGSDPDKPTFLLVAKGMPIPYEVEERMKKKKPATPAPPEKKKDLPQMIQSRQKRIVHPKHKR